MKGTRIVETKIQSFQKFYQIRVLDWAPDDVPHHVLDHGTQ